MGQSSLERGRASYAARAWDRSRAELGSADRERSLVPADLRMLTISSFLSGDDEAAVAASSRAYDACVATADWSQSARCAFWLAFLLSATGQFAQTSAWMERSRRIVDEHRLAGADTALPASFEAHVLAEEGNFEQALALASEAAAVGREYDDGDLRILSQLTVGQALMGVRRGRDALPVYDEIMLLVSSGAGLIRRRSVTTDGPATSPG